MDDRAPDDAGTVVELRAWDIRGREKVLVAERVRDKEGRIRMIWHVQVAHLRGVLWLETLTGSDQTSSASGIE